MFSFALDKEKAETNDDHKSFASHVIRSSLHSFRPTAIFYRPSCLTSSYGSMCSAETSREAMASPLQARHHRLGKIWHFCSPLPFHFLVSTFPLSLFLLPPPISPPSHPAPCFNVWPCMRRHDFSERSLVPPVGTPVLSCSGGLRLPCFPTSSSNAPSVVATTAYVCKLCVCSNRVFAVTVQVCARQSNV